MLFVWPKALCSAQSSIDVVVPAPTLNDTLNKALSIALDRAGFVFVDLLWKAMWLAASLGTLAALLVWFQTDLAAVRLDAPPASLSGPVSAAILARGLWQRYGAAVLWIGSGFLILTFLLWIVMEAYFRAGMLPLSSDGFFSRAAAHFKTFLASSAIKILACGFALIVIGSIVVSRYRMFPTSDWGTVWPETRATVLAGVIVWCIVWGLLSFFETLIRADALQSLADHLFLIGKTIATLVAFEVMVIAGVALAFGVLFSFVSGMAGILLALAACGIGLILLSTLHSFLMLVRFAAVERVALSAG
jgi:hypothetical protein